MSFTHRPRAIVAAVAILVAAAVAITVAVVAGGSASSPTPLARPVHRQPPGIGEHTIRASDGQRIISFWDRRLRATSRPDSQPWVAYVHGGGWIAGSVDERTALAFCNRMALQGITCFSLEYTLVPHAQWPVQSDQITQELGWVRRHGSTFHLDQRAGFAIGHSAGGLMAGVSGLGDGRLAGIVSLAGATNVPYIATHSAYPHLRRHAEELVGNAPPDSERAESASVVDHVRPTTTRVPWLIVQEKHDPAVDVSTSTLLAGQLRDLGFPVTLDEFPGDSHQVNVSGPGVGAVDTWLKQRIAHVRAGEASIPARGDS